MMAIGRAIVKGFNIVGIVIMSDLQNFSKRRRGHFVKEILNDPHFLLGVRDYLNGKEFIDFDVADRQFQYERGRQFAAYLTSIGYLPNIIKSSVSWFNTELSKAIVRKVII
jgi:hypothetical protein